MTACCCRGMQASQGCMRVKLPMRACGCGACAEGTERAWPSLPRKHRACTGIIGLLRWWQAQSKASRFSYVKSLVGAAAGASGSGRPDEPELLCERVLSTATGNWLSHLDWDGHRSGSDGHSTALCTALCLPLQCKRTAWACCHLRLICVAWHSAHRCWKCVAF